ncbi:HK97 family phage prohead protease [Hyphomonas oceanitis]|uniref:HK97 family phage prohead protease n=1 Tax=Hyphomonas oceanitis TaxID=81033 RepID=UPI00138DF454|nr:HK97 family phage prohead protease [Hyphomonas oceanitis]
MAGRFPYNRPAVLSDGGKSGRPVKEEFAPGAFAHTIEEKVEIHLLYGHSFDKPLASLKNGTLKFSDTAAFLELEAILTPEIMETSYAQDLVAQIESGLVTGLSPGFRLPPERAVPRDKAEQWRDEGSDPANGMHNARIRRILEAILVEFSIVTRPAYKEAQVEMIRAQQDHVERDGLNRTLRRWRL